MAIQNHVRIFLTGAAFAVCMASQNALSAQEPQPSEVLTTADATSDTGTPEQRMLDIWGTCYFQYSCQGNPIGLGKTRAECSAQGGHSLELRNGSCYSF